MSFPVSPAASDAAQEIWRPWMQRALQLAALGAGRTSPNPMVGALVLAAA